MATTRTTECSCPWDAEGRFWGHLKNRKTLLLASSTVHKAAFFSKFCPLTDLAKKGYCNECFNPELIIMLPHNFYDFNWPIITVYMSDKLTEVIWSHLKSLEVTWSHLKSFEDIGVIWSHLRSFEIIWSHLRSLGVI